MTVGWTGRLQTVGTVLKHPGYRLLAVAMALAYLAFYLYSLQHIVYAPDVDLAAGHAVPSLQIVPKWHQRTWQVMAPFVWEPIGILYATPHLAVLVSLPNLFLGLALGLLIGANMAVAFYGLATSVARNGTGGSGGSLTAVLAGIPGLLSGLACCVPTVLVSLGSLAAGLTVGLIAVRPYFIPASALMLLLNLAWTARRVETGCLLPAGRRSG